MSIVFFHIHYKPKKNRNMKKIYCILLCFTATTLFFSCNSSKAEKNTPETATISVVPSNPDIHTASFVVKPTVKAKYYNPKVLPLLETVADKLENSEVPYDWSDYTHCNVGLFIQLTNNMGIKEVKDHVNKQYSDYIKYAERAQKSENIETVMEWTRLTNYYCGVTGKPISGIVNTFLQAGFTQGEIGTLEHLSDQYILSKTSIDTKVDQYYTIKENLITYLRAWASSIKEQKAKDGNQYQIAKS